MKHIHTFESFLNEAETSGPYYLQINLRLSMLGGHSIDTEVASSGTQDYADIRDKSGFLKTPAVDKALAELRQWKNKDRSGKIDASFIKEFIICCSFKFIYFLIKSKANSFNFF